MNVLLDTNVVLDFVLDRQPFAEAAEMMFDTAKCRPIQFYLSATTITDLFYIAAKAKGKPLRWS
ncbi:MAG: PIN domain-containing protein [Candidatus Electrothrix sp. EH2]|nr:PIN domain-containing protein [Candidatus Electrothrix sp. EH2]